ncbi:MAG: hypothetical protein V7724_01580 [Sediminicola sp.]
MRIFTNKLKVAKATLSKLLIGCDTEMEYHEIANRISRLELLEAQLLTYVMENSNRLPWIPSSRCKAVVHWYPEERVINYGKGDLRLSELIAGDKEVEKDLRSLIEHSETPVRLKQLLLPFQQKTSGSQSKIGSSVK